MKKRHVVALVLSTNLALFVFLVDWIARNEPDPLHIDGIDYNLDTGPYIASRVQQANDVEGELLARLVFIGDAGDPAETNRESLAMLARWSHEHRDITTTIYLGDNVYSSGFEVEKRARSEGILRAQLEAGGARKIVIPGNHDWGHTDGNLVERIIAQQEYVDNWPGAQFSPRNGCPGPEVITLIGESAGLSMPVVMITLDTKWFFILPSERPECEVGAQFEVMNRLIELLQEYTDAQVIVASHHPVRSLGPHGGFGRDWIRKAYQSIFGSQEMFGKPFFETVMNDYRRAIGSHPPLMYASGHEHSLQLFEGGDVADYLLVSGAGAVGHVNPVTSSPDALFTYASPGFAVMDYLRTGNGIQVVLRMVESAGGEVFSQVIDTLP